MKRFTLLFVTLLCAAQFSGCQGPESNPAAGKSAKVVAAVDEAQGKASLLAFLKAMQNNDKQAAYAASNLTPELVEESRKQLINQPVNKLSKKQVDAATNALRVSGTIDLYLKRLPHILLKSAALEVVKTSKWSGNSPNVLLHEVKITYPSKKEALSDQTGGRIKEFALRFLQIQYESNGRLLQEFLIEDKDFEKIVNRKLDVKSYF